MSEKAKYSWLNAGVLLFRGMLARTILKSFTETQTGSSRVMRLSDVYLDDELAPWKVFQDGYALQVYVDNDGELVSWLKQPAQMNSFEVWRVLAFWDLPWRGHLAGMIKRKEGVFSKLGYFQLQQPLTLEELGPMAGFKTATFKLNWFRKEGWRTRCVPKDIQNVTFSNEVCKPSFFRVHVCDWQVLIDLAMIWWPRISESVLELPQTNCRIILSFLILLASGCETSHE